MKQLLLLLAVAGALVLPAGADNQAKRDAAQAAKQAKEDAKPQPRLVVEGQGGDAKLQIAAKAYLDRASTRDLVGADPGRGFIIVEVTVTPHADEKLLLDLDDFLLRSDKDGQHSRPMSASQVAGSGTLVVKSVGGIQGRGMTDRNQVPYGYPGSYPGTYPGGGGLPRTIPGSGSPTAGSATTDSSEASAVIKEGDAKPNPLLEALKKKQLLDGEYDHPVSGLLYFEIEGPVKPKQLELVYRKAPPRISIRFVDPNSKKK
jgi:hypothetical protein